MRQPATPAADLRGWTTRLAATAVAAALAAVALGAPHVVTLALALTAAGLLTGAALVDWPAGLPALTAWLVVADLLRKFTDDNLLMLAATDAIAAAAIAGWARSRWRSPWPAPLLPMAWPLAGLAVWALVRSAPGAWQEPAVVAVGLHGWFMYVPLLAVGYALRAHAGAWQRWLGSLAWLGVIAAAGVFVQVAVGLDALNPADTSAMQLRVIHTYADGDAVIRPNSIFMHPTRLSGVLYAVLCLLPAMAAPGGWGARRPWALVAVGATVGLALLLSGQRALVAACPVMGVALFGVRVRAARSGGTSTRTLWRGASLAALAMVVALAVAGWASGGGLTAFYWETFVTPAQGRTFQQFDYASSGVRSALAAASWGHGTGTASVGRAHALGVSWDTDDLMPLEGGTGVLAWEWGWPGLLLWAWLVASVVRALWRRCQRATDPADALATAGVLALVLTFMAGWFHLTAGAYQSYALQILLWVTVGSALAGPGAEAGPTRT